MEELDQDNAAQLPPERKKKLSEMTFKECSGAGEKLKWLLRKAQMAFKLRLHRRHERHGARPLCNAHRGHHPLAARQPHRQSGQQPLRARARSGGQGGADRDGRGHRRGRVLKAQKDAAARRRLGGRRGHDRLVRAGALRSRLRLRAIPWARSWARLPP